MSGKSGFRRTKCSPNLPPDSAGLSELAGNLGKPRLFRAAATGYVRVVPSLHPSRSFGELRVLIADDDRRFAESLRATLCSDERVEVIGIASSGAQAVRLAASLLPDIVLMDVRMPGVDGLTATRRIHELGLQCRVLILTGASGDVEEAEALRAGADGFVRKEGGVEQLREVFFEVASLTSALAAVGKLAG